MDKYNDNNFDVQKYTDLNSDTGKSSADTGNGIYIDNTGIKDTARYTSGDNPGQLIGDARDPHISFENNNSAEPQGFERIDAADAYGIGMSGSSDNSTYAGGGYGNDSNWNAGDINAGNNDSMTGNAGRYGNDYAERAQGDVNGNTGQAAGGGRRRRRKAEPKPVTLTRSSLAAIIIICVFLSSTFGFGGAMLATNMAKPVGDSGVQSTNNAQTTGFDLEDATGSEMTVQEITKAALDSVVEIRTESVQMDSWMGQYVTEGAGSGVIIKDNGYIITNNHVVAGASNIIVTTTDKKEYEATLIGTDADTDVAVIKINGQGLKAATMGNSEQLNVGDLAVAIGNPLGELGGTVTAGIISALDRSISIDGKTMRLLQTDTSINPGNSGGGLFNQYGQLVGVVVAKSSGSDVEGLGFAIPINRAAEVASQLMDGGYVKGKPSTGMAYQDISQQQSADPFGFDEFFGGTPSQSGVYIAEINGKNAKKAGFKVGDMVYSVDGKEIDSFETLSSIITSHKVGDKVTYVVLRDGQALEIDLELEEKTE